MQNFENKKEADKASSKELNLIAFLTAIWKKKKLLLYFAIVGAVFGLVIAFSTPKEYKVTVKLAPENSDPAIGGTMGTLASMAGMNLGSMNSDGLKPILYPDIVASTPFLIPFNSMKLKTYNGEKEFTFYEYLLKYQKIEWWNKIIALPNVVISGLRSLFEEKGTSQSVSWDLYSLNEDQLQFLDILSSKLRVSENKKTQVITIDVTMQDPLIATEVADSVVKNLQLYMTNYKTEKSRNDLEYVQKLYSEAKERYYDVQKQYAYYEDVNKNVISSSYALESSRLQNEVTLAFGIYNNLAQQVQMSKAKVQQDTPVLTVLEPAKIPFKPIKPRKVMLLISSVFFFVFIGVIYLFIRELIQLDKNKIKS